VVLGVLDSLMAGPLPDLFSCSTIFVTLQNSYVETGRT
jgi:hypothetical protein